MPDMMDMPGSRIIVVVGMHRSGTSLLARLLGHLGVEFGAGVMTDPVPDNQGGYWEHDGIVSAQEALLEQVLDRPWHRARGLSPLPDGWWKSPEVVPYRMALADIVRRECESANGLFGFKDPRTVRLLPMWREILEELGVRPVFVLAVRSPGAVAESLRRRQGMPLALGALLWLQHNFDAVAGLNGEVSSVVDYDRLINTPGAALASLAVDIGLPGADQTSLNGAAELVNADQRHHCADEESEGWPARVHALLTEPLQDGTFPPDLLEMARTFGRAQPLLAATAMELDAVSHSLDESRRHGRELSDDVASLESVLEHVADLGFVEWCKRGRHAWNQVPEDQNAIREQAEAVARHVGDIGFHEWLEKERRSWNFLKHSLEQTRTDLQAELAHSRAETDHLFSVVSQLLIQELPDQAPHLSGLAQRGKVRRDTVTALLRHLRQSRSRRWSRLLGLSPISDADTLEPRNEFEAVHLISLMLSMRSWRYTRPLRWLESCLGSLFRRLPRGRHSGSVGPASSSREPIGPGFSQPGAPDRLELFEDTYDPCPQTGSYSRLYEAWLRRQETSIDESARSQDRVLFLVHVHDRTDGRQLWRMIESVRRQSHRNWRLLVLLEKEAVLPIPDDAISDPGIDIVDNASHAALQEKIGQDGEVTWDWIAWLRPTDSLAPEAAAVMLALGGDACDLVYADFDRIDDAGHCHSPTFLTGPSPVPLLTASRLDGLSLTARKLADKAGVRFCKTAQERFVQQLHWCRICDSARIRHVPRVLAHRAGISGGSGNQAAVVLANRLDIQFRGDGWRVLPDAGNCADGAGIVVEPCPVTPVRSVVFVMNEQCAPLGPWVRSLQVHPGRPCEVVVLGVSLDTPFAEGEMVGLTDRVRFVQLNGRAAFTEIAASLANIEADVAAVVDGGCAPRYSDSVSLLLDLAAARDVAVAGGVVRRAPVLCDGFRSVSHGSDCLFPKSVDPRCFAFRLEGTEFLDVFSQGRTLEEAVEELCAGARASGSVVVASRRAEFIASDDQDTGGYAPDERALVDWAEQAHAR